MRFEVTTEVKMVDCSVLDCDHEMALYVIINFWQKIHYQHQVISVHSTLQIQVVCSSEILVTTYKITVHRQRENPCCGWLLWCGTGEMFTNWWTRELLLVGRMTRQRLAILQKD
jgi:hypothetical protein